MLRAGFTYHRASGIQLVLGVAVGLGLVEAALLHLVLNAWIPALAWVVSGLEFYGLVWIVGLNRSLPRRPIKVKIDGLLVRYGLLYETFISWHLIEEIETEGLQNLPRRAKGLLVDSPNALQREIDAHRTLQ